jgi:hypothetical protein
MDSDRELDDTLADAATELRSEGMFSLADAVEIARQKLDQKAQQDT